MQVHQEQGLLLSAQRKRRPLFRITALIVVVICTCLSAGALLQTQPRAQVAHAATGAPQMGINLYGPCDYCGDYMFADAMKGARHWGSTSTPWDLSATVDSNGWPTQDAGVVIITPPSGTSVDGTYKLIFTGQATVAGVSSTVTVNNKTYDASTNTTTADLVVAQNSQLYLAFTNTKRNPNDTAGTGVTNVKVMLPTSFGATTSYDPSVTFTTQYKALVQKFSVVRYKDFLATDGSTQTNWSDRRSLNYFSMASGGAWEYVIQLANETNTDAYINVPALATDNDYVTHLAQLFKYGSDANGNVYTSTQTNPVHAPLKSSLHLYIEYSNEVWNTGTGYKQSTQNKDAAVAEVNAGGSPLNYDGDTDQWHWAYRRVAKRIHDISEIFRTVFGSTVMPDGTAQIRPVLEWQTGNTNDTAHQELSFLDDYYNNADGTQHVSTPHPPKYFIWGAGGAAYSGVKSPSASTIDDMYNSGYDTSKVPDKVVTDVTWGRSYGLVHDVAYEGGFQIGGDNPSTLQKQANLDSRAKQMEITTQTDFNQAGGDLLMYFNATSSNYGLTRPTSANLDTPKMQAIDYLNQSTVADITNGTQLPSIITLNSGTFGLNARVNVLVNSPSASTYTPTLNMITSYNNNKFQVLVNDVVVQTVTVAKTSQQTSDVTLNTISLSAGLSAISFRGLTPSDTILNTLTLSNGTPITVTPSPVASPPQQAAIAIAALSAPTIDGSGGDVVWNSASSNAMTHVVNSPSGFSASFQSAWDTDNLYFLVKVSDSTLSGHTDSVEVYIDPTHNGGTSYDPKDMQYIFASNSTTVDQYNGGHKGTNTTGVTFANATVSGGYNVEIKIPWSTLGVTATGNMVIGLDLDAVQGTSGGNKLFWNTTTDNAWTNPGAFGRGVLQPLPTPWLDTDIGSVGNYGSASYSSGTFTVQGSGADIYYTSDAFHYAYQSFSGDGTIVARVASVQNTNSWAKAGVMIRESLDAGAKYAYVMLTPSNGTDFQYRTTTGGYASMASTVTATAPYWVKLVRAGSTFTAYASSDGSTWTQIGSTTISMASSAYIGLAVTAHNNSSLNTSTFDNVSMSLLSPWQDSDIGTGSAGSASYTNGFYYTVKGSGWDIWDTNDAFHYAYQPLNGDGTIVARVASVQNTDGWAKAGVMIRESLTTGATSADMLITPSNGATFQYRTTTGGSASKSTGLTATAPYWVKLVRAGSTFTGYVSSDGTTWTQVGSATISMASNVYIGLAVTAHNSSALNTSTFDNVSVTPYAFTS